MKGGLRDSAPVLHAVGGGGGREFKSSLGQCPLHSLITSGPELAARGRRAPPGGMQVLGDIVAPVALSLPHWTGPVTSAPSPPLESCKSAQGRVQKYRPRGCFLRKSSDPFFFFSGCVLGDHGQTSSLHFTRAQKLWGFTRRQKAIKDSLCHYSLHFRSKWYPI